MQRDPPPPDLLREEQLRLSRKRTTIVLATCACAAIVGVVVALFFALRNRPKEAAKEPERAEGDPEDYDIWKKPAPGRFHTVIQPAHRKEAPLRPMARTDIAKLNTVWLFVMHPLPFGHVWDERTLELAAQTIKSATKASSNPDQLRVVCMDATLRLREKADDGQTTCHFPRPPLHELPHRINTLRECVAYVKTLGADAQGQHSVACVMSGTTFERGWDSHVRSVTRSHAVVTLFPTRKGTATNRFPIVGSVNKRGVPKLVGAKPASKGMGLLPSAWLNDGCMALRLGVLAKFCRDDPECVFVTGQSVLLSLSAHAMNCPIRFDTAKWCCRGAGTKVDFDLDVAMADPSVPSIIREAIRADRQSFRDGETKVAEELWKTHAGRRAVGVSADEPSVESVSLFFMNVDAAKSDEEVLVKYGSAERVATAVEDVTVRMAVHAAKAQAEAGSKHVMKRRKRRRRKSKEAKEAEEAEEPEIIPMASFELA